MSSHLRDRDQADGELARSSSRMAPVSATASSSSSQGENTGNDLITSNTSSSSSVDNSSTPLFRHPDEKQSLFFHQLAVRASRAEFQRAVKRSLRRKSVRRRAPIPAFLVNAKNTRRQTCLHVACSSGNLEVVKLLVEELGAEVNCTDRHGWTPLHCAAQGEHLDIVRLLLDAGADVHCLTTEGASVLHYLVRVCSSDQNGLQTLLESVTLGSRQEPDRMLLNSQNCHGETALHQAAVRGREVAVRVLLSRGADPQLQSRFGETPLHVAARSGHANICRLLLGQGVNSSAASQCGTPLELAQRYAHRDCVQVIRAACETRLRRSMSAAPHTSASLSSSVYVARPASPRQLSVRKQMLGSESSRARARNAQRVSELSSHSPESSPDRKTPSGGVSSTSSSAFAVTQLSSSLSSPTLPIPSMPSFSSLPSSSYSSSFIASSPVRLSSQREDISNSPSASPCSSLRSRSSSSSSSASASASASPLLRCPCVNCGQLHNLLSAVGLHPRGPSVWEALSPKDQSRRARHSFALCKVDNQLFFVRCAFPLRLHLPARFLQPIAILPASSSTSVVSNSPACSSTSSPTSGESMLHCQDELGNSSIGGGGGAIGSSNSSVIDSSSHGSSSSNSSSSSSSNGESVSNSSNMSCSSSCSSSCSDASSANVVNSAGASSSSLNALPSARLTVWVQVSESSFRRVYRWLKAKCTGEGVDFQGRLATALKLFGEETENGLDLSGTVRLLADHRLPVFTLAATKHPLYAAQENGLPADSTALLLGALGVASPQSAE